MIIEEQQIPQRSVMLNSRVFNFPALGEKFLGFCIFKICLRLFASQIQQKFQISKTSLLSKFLNSLISFYVNTKNFKFFNLFIFQFLLW